MESAFRGVYRRCSHLHSNLRRPLHVASAANNSCNFNRSTIVACGVQRSTGVNSRGNLVFHRCMSSSRRPAIPPTSHALQQMTGINPMPHDLASTEQLSADALAKMKKKEEMAQKAAAIQAARIARRKMDVAASLPSNSIPQQKPFASDGSEAKPKPSAANNAQNRVSPFKKFDPFFNYSEALNDANDLQSSSTSHTLGVTSRQTRGSSNNNAPSANHPQTSTPKSAAAATRAFRTPMSKVEEPLPTAEEFAAELVRNSGRNKENIPIPVVKPGAHLQPRARRLFRERDEALQSKSEKQNEQEFAASFEEQQASTADADAGASFTQAPAKPRGPASPKATVEANKHMPRKMTEAELQKQQQQQSGKKGKKKSKTANAANAPKVGSDGKVGLQPGSPAAPQPLAWHPALFLKQLLLKIHPDLFHANNTSGSSTTTTVMVNADEKGKTEKEQTVQNNTMVIVNQEAVAKFNAIVDYYKQIKTLPLTQKHIPNTPALPPHPQQLSFYCKVNRQASPSPFGSPASKSDAAAAASKDKVIKLFEGEWNLNSFDLSSLNRLISQLDELFIRLLLTTEVDVSAEVRARWEVMIRQRKLEKEMWARGEEVTAKTSGGYLTRDPTATSYGMSPGRFQQAYLSYYSQAPSSHEAVAEGMGYKAKHHMSNPFDPDAVQMPPLLERMVRSNLLYFDPSLDMLQRLKCLQTLIRIFSGVDLTHLYVHLWMGVKIHVTLASYEFDDADENYRYSVDEWQIPYDCQEKKVLQLIHQYLHSHHSDNPNGFTLLEQNISKTK